LSRPEQHRAADDDRICYHPKQHYDCKPAPFALRHAAMIALKAGIEMKR